MSAVLHEMNTNLKSSMCYKCLKALRIGVEHVFDLNEIAQITMLSLNKNTHIRINELKKNNQELNIWHF